MFWLPWQPNLCNYSKVTSIWSKVWPLELQSQATPVPKCLTPPDQYSSVDCPSHGQTSLSSPNTGYWTSLSNAFHKSNLPWSDAPSAPSTYGFPFRFLNALSEPSAVQQSENTLVYIWGESFHIITQTVWLLGMAIKSICKLAWAFRSLSVLNDWGNLAYDWQFTRTSKYDIVITPYLEFMYLC